MRLMSNQRAAAVRALRERQSGEANAVRKAIMDEQISLPNAAQDSATETAQAAHLSPTPCCEI